MSAPIPQNPLSDAEQGVSNLEKADSLTIDHEHDDHDTDHEEDFDHLPRLDCISPIRSSKSYLEREGKGIGSNLAKVLTARSNASVRDPGPPPDSGLKAWTQALMGHLVLFNTWGMISSFGVFQTYYTTELGLNPSAVSWIGSMQMLGHFSIGMLSGRALDAGLFYWVLIPGLLCASLGMFMTSLCTQYWQFFLAQGVLNGIGCGLQFTPSMSLVSTYFSKNRSVAITIVASGSATGGLIYPTIARQLLPQIGFAWTVRVMGFLMLAVGACYVSLLKPRLPPRKTGPLLELSAFGELPYTLYLAGIFFACWGSYFAFYYIGSYGVDVVGVSYSTSVNLLMIMNAIGLVGRIIPGLISDRYFGPINTLIPSAVLSGVVLYFWALVKTESGLYAFSIVYGLITAGFQGLFPAGLTSLTKDASKVGVRNGMGFAIAGLANFTGPPIAGAIIQRDGGRFLIAQIWGGCMVLVGSVILIFGRLVMTGKKFRVRV